MVVSFADYREAHRVRLAIDGALSGAPWLVGTRVRLLASGKVGVVIQTRPLVPTQREALRALAADNEICVEEAG